MRGGETPEDEDGDGRAERGDEDHVCGGEAVAEETVD